MKPKYRASAQHLVGRQYLLPSQHALFCLRHTCFPFMLLVGSPATKKFHVSFLPWQVMTAKHEPGKLFLLPLPDTRRFSQFTQHVLEVASAGNSRLPRGDTGPLPHESEGPQASGQMMQAHCQCGPMGALRRRSYRRLPPCESSVTKRIAHLC